MKAEDRVKKVHIDIMRHKRWCAVSGLLACGKTTMDATIPTACTNGWDVQYSPAFVDTLTEQELRFVVLHENAGHKAYRHLTMWRKLWERDRRLANIAADHFVNLTLVETDGGEGFITMPKVGIKPEVRFHGMSVSQIFEILESEPPPDGRGQGGGGQGQGEPGEGEQGLDEHDWEGASEHSAEQQAAQGEEIERAMRQGEILRRQRGKGSSGQDGVFGDLLTPKQDWREVLRDFITETCAGKDESSWARPNRRFLASDVYMPSMVGTTLAELAVVIDTSGSCFGGAEMTRFVSELATIIDAIKPGKCHVLYCDTLVTGMQTFEEGQFAVQDLKITGGGGTHLPAAFDYLKDHSITPQAMVIFTDMYTAFGESPGYPVLWAATTPIKAPWGTTLTIGD